MPDVKNTIPLAPADMLARNIVASDSDISSKTYGDLVLHVIEYLYAHGYVAPNQSQIVKIILEIKNSPVCTYEEKNIQPSVSRALRSFVSRRKIILQDKTFRPYNVETSRELLSDEIVETIKFGPQDIFLMSATTMLLDIERSSMSRAIELFSRYLGPNCYNVLEFNGYLMLLISGKKEEVADLRKKIKAIQKSAAKKNKEGMRS